MTIIYENYLSSQVFYSTCHLSFVKVMTPYSKAMRTKHAVSMVGHPAPTAKMVAGIAPAALSGELNVDVSICRMWMKTTIG